MNTFLKLLVLMALTSVPVNGQPLRLFDGTELCGFLAPSLSVSTIHNQTGVTAGAVMGLVFDHTIVLAVEGSGLVTHIYPASRSSEHESRLEMISGGLLLEYLFDPKEMVHLSLRATAGGGGVRYHGRVRQRPETDGGASALVIDVEIPLGENPDSWDGYWFLEPGAGVEVIAAENIRVELSARYRVVSGVRTDGISSQGLSGPSLGLLVKCGLF